MRPHTDKAHRVFIAGTLQTRRTRKPCGEEGVHHGPFIRNLQCEGWLGLVWWDCKCGSTVVLNAGHKPERAA